LIFGVGKIAMLSSLLLDSSFLKPFLAGQASLPKAKADAD
jgi:hypothetical protein